MSQTESPGRPRWARHVSGVLIALTQSRYILRRAAQRSGNRRVATRLRRLAQRRRAAVTELERLNPPPVTDSDLPAIEGGDVFASEMHAATEIGSLAACLRANRRLRGAIDKALAAAPPQRMATKLEALRDQADLDAAGLNLRLRELVAVPGPTGAAPGTVRP